MKKKNIIQKGIKYISDSNYRFVIKSGRGIYNNLDDKEYLQKLFKAVMKKELDLNNPQTFNEKLQWLKLYDRRPEYTIFVDKYKVRNYIAKKLGQKYLIPLLGVWDNPEDIDFATLPNQFVLKCNHNSGLGMCICNDKSKLNIKKVKEELRKGLKQDYYLTGREWPYKNVKRKIIAEKYMGADINDYKLQCFNGKFDNILVCTGRQSKNGVKYYYFDKDWNYLSYSNQIDNSLHDYQILKPQNYEKMIELAEILAKECPELRVDFYEIEGEIYFGEMTFFTQSGFDTSITREADMILGSKLKLEKEVS